MFVGFAAFRRRHPPTLTSAMLLIFLLRSSPALTLSALALTRCLPWRHAPVKRCYRMVKFGSTMKLERMILPEMTLLRS